MAEDYFRQWYSNIRPIYEGLTNVVRNTLEVLIKRERIDYLSITSRTKSLDSLLEKIKRKSYRNQEEVTDFAGIRVITFIETDVPKICNLIKDAFKVYPTKSLDKTEELGADRFGYRSVHYVCDLGDARVRLPELSPYKGLLFEIQIRTVLQHAWAEIEHDRNYKFSDVLPTYIQRRLHSVAGVLEMVDREFAVLANEVDRYAEEVLEKTRLADLDIEDTASLLEYLPTKISRTNKGVSNLIGTDTIPEVVIDELLDFGIHTLADLDKILSKDLLELIVEYQPYTTYSGLLRVAMMYEDIDRYFAKAWKQNWKLTDYDSPDLLGEKYGRDKVKQILAVNDVDIIRDAIRYEDRDIIDIIRETIRYEDRDG